MENARTVTDTCNTCGAIVNVSRDSDAFRFGRIYCESHSVFRPQYRAVREAFAGARRLGRP